MTVLVIAPVVLIAPFAVAFVIAFALRRFSKTSSYPRYWWTALGLMSLWAVTAIGVFARILAIQAARPDHVPGGPGPGLENLMELVTWWIFFSPSFPALIVTIAYRRKRFAFGILELFLAIVVPAVIFGIARPYFSARRAANAPRQRWFDLGITPALGKDGKPVGLLFTRSSNLDALRGQEQLISLSVRAEPAEFDKLRFVPNLLKLDIGGRATTDETLKYLKLVPKLKSLDMTGSLVTSDGLAALAVLHGLEELNVSRTVLGDNALDQLRTLGRLRSLRAYRTKITGRGFCGGGFAHLAGLTLDDCPVDEVGLRCIVALPAIQSVSVSGTNITGSTIQQIRQELKAVGSKIDIGWLPKR